MQEDDDDIRPEYDFTNAVRGKYLRYTPEAMSAAAKTTKERIKSEIDKVRDEYLGVLYRIVLALEEPANVPAGKAEHTQEGEASWARFIAEMYGSTADAPLERGAQVPPESRLVLE